MANMATFVIGHRRAGSKGSARHEDCHHSTDQSSVYTISGLYSQVPQTEDADPNRVATASHKRYGSVGTSTDNPKDGGGTNKEWDKPLLPVPAMPSATPQPSTVTPHSATFELSVDPAGMRDCGICNCRPLCLQRFANVKLFVFLCCLLVTLQQTLSSGYLNSVITTIEKRFDMPSGMSGAIASTYEFGNLVTIIFVSYLGSRRHIPVWLGIGILVMASGSLLFVLPHFISETYTLEGGNSENSTEENICRAPHLHSPHEPHFEASEFLAAHSSIVREPRACNEGSTYRALPIFIFMVAQLFIGSGASPIFTLGTTYVDDHVPKDSASMYIGCMYSMVTVGPVCGFLLGGFLLSFYVDFMSYSPTQLQEMGLHNQHPRWVGAWWGGFLVIGCLLLLLAVPFFAFPKSLECEKKKKRLHEEAALATQGASGAVTSGSSHNTSATTKPTTSNSDNEGFTTEIAKKKKHRVKKVTKEAYGKNVKDIPLSIWSLLSNPVFLVTCFGSCMELMIVSGFIVFLPKYLETQFSINKSQASIFTGGIAIPGACVGTLMGGFLLKKLELTPKGAIQFVMLFNVLSFGLYILVFFLGCDNLKMAGATMPYFNSSSSPFTEQAFQANLTAKCNLGCECSQTEIQPICGSNGITYFSPCHAGCTSLVNGNENSQNYYNCACILENGTFTQNFQEVIKVPVATSGACNHLCDTIIPFMVLLFMMSLGVSITQMPLLMIVLRSVSEEERSFALGMQFVIFRIFGYIPSPIMFGNVIDSTCLLWRAHCGVSSGFCHFYDIEKFRYRYVGICMGIKFLAGLLFLLDWFLIRRRYHKNEEITMMSVGDIATSMLSLDKIATDDKEKGSDDSKPNDEIDQGERNTMLDGTSPNRC